MTTDGKDGRATQEAERFESFGPYRFLMPPFWPDHSVNERGPVFTSVAKLNDVQCVLLVYVGGAADPNAKTDFLAARGADAKATRCDTQAVGVAFEGHRFERGAEVELVYLLTVHGDLITANCRFAAGNAEAEKLSLLLLTMAGAAVVRRGPVMQEADKTNEGSFWKRLFGG